MIGSGSLMVRIFHAGPDAWNCTVAVDGRVVFTYSLAPTRRESWGHARGFIEGEMQADDARVRESGS